MEGAGEGDRIFDETQQSGFWSSSAPVAALQEGERRTKSSERTGVCSMQAAALHQKKSVCVTGSGIINTHTHTLSRRYGVHLYAVHTATRIPICSFALLLYELLFSFV